MRKIVLVVALLGFVAAVVGGSLNSQQCVPCVAVFLGAAAGYLACRVTRPETQALASRSGVTAGVISGLGATLGHLVGGVIGAVRLGPGGAEDLARSFGLSVPEGLTSPTMYFQSALGLAGFCGVVELFLMAGAGAVGGIIWYQQTQGRVRPPAAAR